MRKIICLCALLFWGYSFLGSYAKQVRSSSSDSSVNFNIVVMSGSNEVSSSSMNTTTDNRKILEGTGYCARFNQNDSMSWRFTAIEGHTKSTYIYIM